MNDKLFNTFFYGVFILTGTTILISVIGQIFIVTVVAKQDFSNGIIPPIEKVLCGHPGCLKTYLKNQ